MHATTRERRGRQSTTAQDGDEERTVPHPATRGLGMALPAQHPHGCRYPRGVRPAPGPYVSRLVTQPAVPRCAAVSVAVTTRHGEDRLPGNTSAFTDIARSRRSPRRFLPATLSPSDIRGVLEDAQTAPANSNTQPWTVHVVSALRLCRHPPRVPRRHTSLRAHDVARAAPSGPPGRLTLTAFVMVTCTLVGAHDQTKAAPPPADPHASESVRDAIRDRGTMYHMTTNRKVHAA